MISDSSKFWLKSQKLNIRRSINSLIEIKIRNDLLAETKDNLLRSRGRFQGQTVFCIGNGPSLSNDHIKLASKHAFVATNRAYQLFEPKAFGIGGRGWLIINDFYRSLEVLPSLDSAFNQVVVGCHNPRNIYLYRVLLRPSWIFANCSWSININRKGISCSDNSHLQEFSPDFARRYYSGWSIIFSAIQFAAYLGAARIVLIGCDMDYSGPLQYSGLIKDDRLAIGHLGTFNYEEHGSRHMISCRNGLRALGVEILNATPAGAINEIPRISLEDLSQLLESESLAFRSDH